MTFTKFQDTFSTAENLNSLILWCEENISKDFKSESNSQEIQYADYFQFAKYYIETFLPQAIGDQSTALFHHMNAIQYAAYQGYHFFIKQNPMNLNVPTETGMTPLHLAATQGHFHTVTLLLQLGASPIVKNTQQQYPIYCALLPNILEKDLSNHEKTYRILLQKAPETWLHADIHQITLFHLMATYGYHQLLKEALQENPEIAFFKNKAGQCPIHSAILNQQIDIALELLNIEGVSEQLDAQLQTPLHYIAKFIQHTDLIQCCIAKSLHHINQTDGEGRTAYMLAIENHNSAVIHSLEINGADKTMYPERRKVL